MQTCIRANIFSLNDYMKCRHEMTGGNGPILKEFNAEQIAYSLAANMYNMYNRYYTDHHYFVTVIVKQHSLILYYSGDELDFQTENVHSNDTNALDVTECIDHMLTQHLYG